MSLPMCADCDPPEQLQEIMDRRYQDFLDKMSGEHLRMLHEAQEHTGLRIRDFEAVCASVEAELWGAIRVLRGERRQNRLSAQRQARIDARLQKLLDLPDLLARGMRRHIAQMRRETEALEDTVLTNPSEHAEIEHFFTVRWTSRSQRRGMTIQLPIFQEEPYSADAWRTCGQQVERSDGAMPTN
jgi:hypothetical protein